MHLTIRQSTLALILILSLPLLLGGCASTGGGGGGGGRPVASTATFPVPDEIQGNVNFWRNVYAHWSRRQVAFHDDEYMDVIFEVANLPGPVKGGYTASQKRLVKAKTAEYRSRLRSLEQKVSAGMSLSSNEQALFDKFEDAGGRKALYGAHDRVRSQRGLRERFHTGLETSGRYDQAFRQIMRSRGVPEDLAYLPHVESSFQAHARSSVGAAGMWQFTRGTGKIYMTVNNTIDDRLDPVIAADGASRYLRDAHQKLNSWPLAITSYNHGQGGMVNAKRQYGDDIGRIVRRYKGKYFKFASRNFYSEFIAAREVASHPDRYFPEGVRFQKPLAEDRIILKYPMPGEHIARHYGVSVQRLNDMNRHWLKRARNGANLPPGSIAWLPLGSTRKVASQPPPVRSWVSRTASITPKAAAPKLQPVVRTNPKQEAVIAKAHAKPKTVAAKAPPKPTPVVAKRQPKPKPEPVAKKAPPKAVVAKAEPAHKKQTVHHVVQPEETLYRVAKRYELSVAQLRELNKMKPDDNTIRVGQRLRVSS